jgi:hypothetical protein
MKVDKEFIIKNHFWILLFIAVGLSLVGWLLMFVSVPGTVNAKRDEVQKEWDGGKNYKEFKHPDYVKRAQDEAEARDKERLGVHESLYADQAKEARLNTWPRKMVEVGGFDFSAGKYATEIVVKAATKPNEVKKLLTELTNDATHINGKLLVREGESDYVVIETKDKKQVKVLKTPTVKVTDEGAKDDSKKNLEFAKLAREEYDNRVLAITFVTGRYVYEDLSDSEIALFAETYKDQLADVLAEMGPLNVLGEPIVQIRYDGGSAGGGGYGMGKSGFGAGSFRPKPGFGDAVGPGSGFPGGGVPGGKQPDNDPAEEDAFGPETWIFRPGKLPPAENRIFPYVSKWDKNLTDISEEIWAAQEDLWIQRELFKRIKLANDAVARFTPASKAQVAKDHWHKFTNFYWELELKIVGEGVQAKIKNLRPRRQSLDGLHFLVKLSNSEAPVLFPPKDSKGFESVPLAPNEVYEMPEAMPMPAGTKLDGVFAVDQVLTWETAAVKRIEVVTIGAGANGDPAVCQRQAWMKLVPFKKKKDAPAEPASEDVAGAKGKVAGLTPGPGTGAKGGAAAEQATGFGRHGVLLDRYLEVTPELRKVPINIVLIVDPDHIAKVEKAFVESPLRFLTTQVMWQRCAVSLRPPDPNGAAAEKGPGFGDMPKGPGAYRGKYGSAGMFGPPGGFSAPGAFGAGQPAPDASAGNGDEQENLELSIYGVITLYERPGRPAPGADQPQQQQK